MRVVQLRKFVAMLDEMAILMRFKALRTKEIITEISKHESFGSFIFLNTLNDCLELDDDISASWCEAAHRAVFLNESDKNILIGVGEQIGGTDIEGQLSMLAMSKTLAEQNLLQAENEYRIKGRMLRTVWSLCGLAAGIMVI